MTWTSTSAGTCLVPDRRRHNLVRLREALSLTQADLGALVGRAETTIKAIEIGKLALSPNLAALIAAHTGADPAWLLTKDLKSPMPPLKRFSSTLDPEAKTYDYTLKALGDLFLRLFAIFGRLKNSEAKTELMHWIEREVKFAQAHPAGNPASEPWLSSQPAVYEFFKAHPELLDPDLFKLINLEFLIKDSYLRGRLVAAETRAVNRALKQEAKPRRRKAPTRNPE